MDAPKISPFVLWFFRGIVRGYFRRHFTAVRLSRASNLTGLTSPRLLLYANHSSWWDPMVLVLLGAKLLPTRRHYAPMDATELNRYGIFKYLGVFGVDPASARGAAKFLRTGTQILKNEGVLWVTPQGRFADTREHPLAFKPGLAALAAKLSGGCTVQPLAIEYVFWNERLPETLLHLGDPITIDGQSVEEAQQLLESALQTTMDALKQESVARNPGAFTILHRGTEGTGGFYQLGQRTLARLRGKPFQPAHTPAPEERG